MSENFAFVIKLNNFVANLNCLVCRIHVTATIICVFITKANQKSITTNN